MGDAKHYKKDEKRSQASLKQVFHACTSGRESEEDLEGPEVISGSSRLNSVTYNNVATIMYSDNHGSCTPKCQRWTAVQFSLSFHSGEYTCTLLSSVTNEAVESKNVFCNDSSTEQLQTVQPDRGSKWSEMLFLSNLIIYSHSHLQL